MKLFVLFVKVNLMIHVCANYAKLDFVKIVLKIFILMKIKTIVQNAKKMYDWMK